MKRTLRYINRLLLLILLLAVIFPFTFPLKDGRPLLSWSDIQLPRKPDIDIKLPTLSAAGEANPSTPSQSVILYRWRDGNGGLQFSNLQPPQGVAYEIIKVNPETNLVQGVGTEDNVMAERTDGDTAGPALPSPLSVSPEEAAQLLEEARRIQALSEERVRQQEALTR